ncbi:hypothetical protein ACFY00_37820 [Kitasatospora sp. NPDC001540]|uniref:hypothetical protein n=1 Tax=Kitasatospora sp. NPDC001540 TaxID=3364014 RepID=UPI0036AE0490
MTDSTPEDDEPVSFATKTKNWCEKHKPKLYIALGVTVTVGVGLFAAARHLAEQDDENHDAEEIAGLEPTPDDEVLNEPRQSYRDPDREPFLRRLPPGQQASEASKAKYRDLYGTDLPDGVVPVDPWRYGKKADEDAA